MKVVKLVLLFLFLLLLSSLAAAEDGKKTLRPSRFPTQQARFADYQEVLNVTAPTYPGLDLDVLTLEDSIAREPEHRVTITTSELTAEVTHQISTNNYGFYSARPYKSGVVYSMTTRK